MAWQGRAVAGFCVAPCARGRTFVYELHVAEEARRCKLGIGHVVQRTCKTVM